MNKIKVVILTLSVAIVLAACSSAPDQPTDESALETVTPIVDEGGSAALEDTTWQWVSLVETEPAAQSVVPSPESYTVSFLPDGELSIQADCNTVGGSYVLDGGNLTVSLGPSTQAFCGEQSLDLQYLELLGNVESYTLQDGQLVLELSDGAGRMTFRAG